MKVVEVFNLQAVNGSTQPSLIQLICCLRQRLNDPFSSLRGSSINCTALSFVRLSFLRTIFAMNEFRLRNVRLLCDSFCNATVNDSGFCPSRCVPECPATCHYLRIPSTINASSPLHFNRIYKLDTFFVVTFACLAVVLIGACIYAVYLKHYSVRGRAQQRPEQEVQIFDQIYSQSPSLGLQAATICAIKVHTYMKADDHSREMECAVCLSEFQDGEVLRILPKCNHAFHMPCVDVWLGSHVSCPMCRACIESHITIAPASEDQSSLVNVVE